MGHPAPQLVLTPSTYAAAAHLIAELDDDLGVRYGVGSPVAAHPEQFLASASGAFLVAWVEGEQAGCGGLRSITAGGGPGVAELKRMWVRPTWRGRGVARALLAGCEDAARSLGHRELWLETGLAQPEAIALYTSAGYRPVPPFGQYAEEADSVHLGRRL